MKERITDIQGRLIGRYRPGPEFDDLADELLRNSEVSESSTNSRTVEYIDARVRMFQDYARRFGNPSKVFYPACGTDISPSKGFPGSEITYLDIDDESIRTLEAEGIPTQKICITKNRNKYDLVLLINPGFGSGHVIKNISKHGRVIASGGNHAAGGLYEEGLPIVGEYILKEGDVVYTPRTTLEEVADANFYVFERRKNE